jgi:hypothetical protein
LFVDFLAASADHLLTLIVGIGPVIYTLNHPDPQTQSILFCKLRGYIFQITLMLSRWFVAFACIDRYASCSDKASLRNFAKTRVAYHIIIIITIVWLIVCIHRFIFYEIRDNLCGILMNTGAAIYHSLYVIIGGGILPTIIMITCALFIRANLAHRQQKRGHIPVMQNQPKSSDQQVLRLLFIQIICYNIFTIPQLFNVIFSIISSARSNRSREHLAIERFITFIAELMLYLFPVTSFYLYTLTSRTFRNELIDFLRSISRMICLNTQNTTMESITTVRHNVNGEDYVEFNDLNK